MGRSLGGELVSEGALELRSSTRTLQDRAQGLLRKLDSLVADPA